jgi:hypothetical protein
VNQGSGESRIELVTAQLNRLLNAYRELLVATTTLPALGRVGVNVVTEQSTRRAEAAAAGATATSQTAAPKENQTAEPRPEEPHAGTLRRRWRWVSRLPVRLYAEIHVRRQLRHILRLLDREALRVGRDDQTLSYRELRAQLQDHADHVTTWPGVARVFRTLPVVPATTGLVVAWYIGVGASRPSGSEVLWALFSVALLVLTLQILLVAPSIRLGFRAKRALFNGGTTDMGPLATGRMEALGTRILWRTLSNVNGYRLEDEVFKALGWEKRKEQPLDLYFTLPHFGFLVIAAFFIGGAAVSQDSEGFWGSLGLAFLFLLAEASLLRTQWHTYRQRRKLGEM